MLIALSSESVRLLLKGGAHTLLSLAMGVTAFSMKIMLRFSILTGIECYLQELTEPTCLFRAWWR